MLLPCVRCAQHCFSFSFSLSSYSSFFSSSFYFFFSPASQDGATPLVRAVERSCAHAVQTLLTCGADPNLADRVSTCPLIEDWNTHTHATYSANIFFFLLFLLYVPLMFSPFVGGMDAAYNGLRQRVHSHCRVSTAQWRSHWSGHRGLFINCATSSQGGNTSCRGDRIIDLKNFPWNGPPEQTK